MQDVEWDYWLTRPYIYNWEAAALVTGLNPREIKFPTRDSVGELHFDKENFGDLYPIFKSRLDQLTEHAWMQSFSAQNMRVDFRRFLFWAQKVRKWSMPERLSAFAQNIDIEALDENVEEKVGVLRDERNSLQLIWALRKLLKEHQYGKTDRELIYYLSKTYPDQKAFKRLSLEMKFAEAQVASEA